MLWVGVLVCWWVGGLAGCGWRVGGLVGWWVARLPGCQVGGWVGGLFVGAFVGSFASSLVGWFGLDGIGLDYLVTVLNFV